MIVAMARDGAITFSDLIGKLDVLRVTCTKCERAGRYRLHRRGTRSRCEACRLARRDHRRLPEEDRARHERSVRRAVPGFAEGAVAPAGDGGFQGAVVIRRREPEG